MVHDKIQEGAAVATVIGACIAVIGLLILSVVVIRDFIRMDREAKAEQERREKENEQRIAKGLPPVKYSITDRSIW